MKTPVRERPITFSAPMVLANLKLLKTMTRRTRGLERINETPDQWEIDLPLDDMGFIRFRNKLMGETFGIKCPYGVVGDRLWLREAWRVDFALDHLKPSQISVLAKVYYEADCQNPIGGKLRQAMFMPRWMSRGLFEITEIECERVQDITEEDARAEGIFASFGDERWKWSESGPAFSTERLTFAWLWNSVKGPDAWNRNEWVWVIEFKVVKP